MESNKISKISLDYPLGSSKNTKFQIWVKTVESFFEELGLLNTFPVKGNSDLNKMGDNLMEWEDFDFTLPEKITLEGKIDKLIHNATLIEEIENPTQDYKTKGEIEMLIVNEDKPVMMMQDRDSQSRIYGPEYYWGFYYDPSLFRQIESEAWSPQDTHREYSILHFAIPIRKNRKRLRKYDWETIYVKQILFDTNPPPSLPANLTAGIDDSPYRIYRLYQNMRLINYSDFDKLFKQKD